MLSALRDFGETWQTFWGCDENNVGGVLGVLVDGVAFTGSTLNSANSYTGTVTATGLSAGTHTWQMTLGGVATGSSYTFTTAPASGDSFSLLFMGDTNTEVNAAMLSIANRETPAAVFGTELFYIDGSSYGGALYTDAHDLDPSASWPSSLANTLDANGATKGFRVKYRTAYSSEPNRLVLMRKCPIYHLPGNHDLGISDSGSLTPVPGMVRYDAAHQAEFEYPNAGHPVPSGDVDTEPSPLYYFNKVIGDVEIIVCDMQTYSNPTAGRNLNQANGATPNGAGEDKQVAWIKTTLSASTANVIILFTTGNVPLTSNVAAYAEWAHATTGLWKYIDGINKTVMMISGDSHIHYCFLRKTNASSQAGLLDMGCSPSAGVTSCNPFAPISGDVEYFNDMEQALLTVGYTGGVDTVINVNQTGSFRANRRLTNQYGVTYATVQSVELGAKTVTLASAIGGSNQAAGTVVRNADWPATADVGTKYADLASYIKVTRNPDGDNIVPTASSKVEFICTTSGRVKYSFYVKDGQRVPYFPRPGGMNSGIA